MKNDKWKKLTRKERRELIAKAMAGHHRSYGEKPKRVRVERRRVMFRQYRYMRKLELRGGLFGYSSWEAHNEQALQGD